MAHTPSQRARSERRIAARHDVLERAMETMLALIRMHVAGCEKCAKVICSGGMEELLRKVDAELRAAAEKVAGAATPRRSSGRPRMKRIRTSAS